MTASTAHADNIVTHWLSKVHREYVRGGRFGKHTGNDTNSIFHTVEDEKIVSIPLIAKLAGAGVTGSTALVGSEEALSNYAYTLAPTYKRNAVTLTNEERQKTEFDLIREATPALQNWMMELKRDEMIQALGAIMDTGVYSNYGGAVGKTGATAAAATDFDAYNTANADRILYGTAVANYSAGDHTASLAAVANTEKSSYDQVTLLKRMAENADPLIRPVMINGDEPWYIYYIGSLGFRDIQVDLKTLHSNAEVRGEGNPLWSGGDLMIDGVIIKKIPEIDHFIDGTGGSFGGVWGAGATADGLHTAGTASARIGAGFLCGAQAVGFGIGHMPTMETKNETDYNHSAGVAIAAKHDIGKTFYNNVQHGVVTSYHAAALDA